MIKQEFIWAIIGGIFVIETISVALQVASYRLRGKRIFLMAPIHHHFEKLGWLEEQITHRFTWAAFFFGVAGLVLYFLSQEFFF